MTAVRPFGRGFIWAPTGTEANAFDQMAIEKHKVPQTTLIECAGRSAAQVLDRIFPDGEVVGIIGSGNNGSDGIVLLRTLKSWGRSVKAVLVADRSLDDPLLHGWDVHILNDGMVSKVDDRDGNEVDDCGVPINSILDSASVVVDCILGTGIKGAPRPRQTQAIQAINRSRCPVFALDTPSGIDCDTGCIEGEAVTAQVTVALGWPKLGTLLHPGRDKVGRLISVEIGFPPAEENSFGAALVTPEWAVEKRPERDTDTHKNRVGALLLVAGNYGMAGAVIMAARSALRAGVGLLRIVSTAENRDIIQRSVPEAVFVSGDDLDAVVKSAGSSHAVAVGPGLGEDPEVLKLLEIVRDATVGIPTVLDADALNSAASGQAPSIKSWSVGQGVLVTPHIGEMNRLSGLSPDVIAKNRILSARRFAVQSGVVVLLKGLPSVVVPPDGICWIDTVGTSDLATGGMGDVLTGVAGALLSQGLTPDIAGALSLYITGRAAVLADKGRSLTPSDVIDEIPSVWDENGVGETDLDLPFVVFDQDVAR